MGRQFPCQIPFDNVKLERTRLNVARRIQLYIYKLSLYMQRTKMSDQC